IASFVTSASSFSSGKNTMATSAPSRAYSVATDLPIPESPPVTIAFKPSSFPDALYSRPSNSGFGRKSFSRPDLSFFAGHGGFASPSQGFPPHDGVQVGKSHGCDAPGEGEANPK